jgi:putative transposase
MDRYSFVVRLLHSLHLAAFTGAPPDLNPTELIWGNIKSSELANLCTDTIAHVADIAEDGLNRISSDAALCFAFLRHTGLRL